MTRFQVADTLARIFSDPEQAVRVCRTAGVPPGQIPNFRVPSDFWHRVVEQLENGLTPGGLTPFLEVAYRETGSPEIWALLNGDDERVQQIIDLLASLLSDRENAEMIVRRAGLPAHLVPVFRSAGTFWHAVVNAAAGGSAPLVGLLHEALQLFPYNQDLKAMAQSLRQSPLRPAKPAAAAPPAPPRSTFSVEPSGRTLALVLHIPGARFVLFRAAVSIAPEEQREACENVRQHILAAAEGGQQP